ncbi:putative methyltransferase-domain-containing protein [Entophlyctis helioformis]|nr:putative methyltransferase-domain-containing protein [Entophlyctis helioformis]
MDVQSRQPQRMLRRVSMADTDGSHAVSVVVQELVDPSYGSYLWPSALILSAFMCLSWRQLVADMAPAGGRTLRILELGAGTALPGLLAARLCAQHARTAGQAAPEQLDMQAAESVCEVVLTDHPDSADVLASMARAADLNGMSGMVRVEPLAWGDFGDGMHKVLHPAAATLQSAGGFDLILGADVMYDPKDFDDLLATVAFILERSPPHAVFLMAYQERSSRRSVQWLLDKWGLAAEQVHTPALFDMLDWIEASVTLERCLLPDAGGRPGARGLPSGRSSYAAEGIQPASLPGITSVSLWAMRLGPIAA